MNFANADGTIQIVSETDPSLQLANMKIIVQSGSLSDPTQHPGLANFTGRALLRGTLTRPYKDLTTAIERLGASITVSSNATDTTFSATVLAKNFDPFMDIVRDIFMQPAFDVGEMSILQGIIQGEILSSLEDPATLASRALLASTYANTNLSYPAEGTGDSISHFTPQNVRDFFTSHYLRDNIVIGIASPFTSDDVSSRILPKLNGLPAGSVAPISMPAPTIAKKQALIVDKKGLATVPIFVAIPGASDSDPDGPALDVANFVFGGDFTSRLMQELRVKEGWTYGVSSGFNQLLAPARDPGLFSIYLYPTADFTAAIPGSISTTLSMLGDSDEQTNFVWFGITSAEFTAAQSALEKNYVFTQDTAEKRLAARIRELETGRPNYSVQQYQTMMSGLTVDAVNAAVRKHLHTTNTAIVVVGDASQLKPIFDRVAPTFSTTIVTDAK